MLYFLIFIHVRLYESSVSLGSLDCILLSCILYENIFSVIGKHKPINCAIKVKAVCWIRCLSFKTLGNELSSFATNQQSRLLAAKYIIYLFHDHKHCATMPQYCSLLLLGQLLRGLLSCFRSDTTLSTLNLILSQSAHWNRTVGLLYFNRLYSSYDLIIHSR